MEAIEETEDMKITAISPWFGSKRTLAKTIVQELGPHRSYWELACGSCAVLLAKPPSSQEAVNDLHGDLINLAMVLASDLSVLLYERLTRTLYSEEFFRSVKQSWIQSAGIDPPPDPQSVTARHVERAWVYMVMSWMGRNGAAGTERCNYQMAIRWTPNGGSGPTRWKNVVESIPAWHKRFRSVCILNKDLFEVAEKIEDCEGVSIYADPPYIKSTRSKGGTRYLHEFDHESHSRLADTLRRFKKARVIVSYYDDPQLDELYPGWTKRLVYMNKNLHVQNRRGAEKIVAPEVLLINGPSLAN